jgi:predicted AAA+ superfamily ATPase
MIPRLSTSHVRARLKRYPAVALLGPRQAGKTTLARTFSGKYFDLEQAEDRLKLDIQWDSLVGSSELAVLDEAQAMPDVFPRIRGAIDAGRTQNGRFLLLGSVSPALMKNVSESLAGRLAICTLQPFVLPEIRQNKAEDDLWLRGGFPGGGILRSGDFPGWERDYLTLLAQRDLPGWGLPARPQVTQRLFRMLAASHAQIWNASKIGASMGLSYHTVNHYLDYLENAFLILTLRPYHVNLRKRLVRSPKIYWRDTGLLHALLGVKDTGDLLSQPWVGASWEGWCISQILATLEMIGEEFEAYYLRTAAGLEIDLLVKFRKGLWAFEFKLTSAPDAGDMGRLSAIAELVGADRQLLVSRTSRPEGNSRKISTNIGGCLKLLLDN